MVFQGDRRFHIVVRLPDRLREDLAGLENLPVPVPRDEQRRRRGELAAGLHPAQSRGRRSRLGEGPNQISRENGKRRVVVQANVRGRDIGSFVAEAQAKIERAGQGARGQLAGLGRAVREPASPRATGCWSSCRPASSSSS